MFTNKAFVNDKSQPSASNFKNGGFLNKRPSNTDNALHQTLDSMVHDLNGTNFKKGKLNVAAVQVIAEGFKGRRYKDLSPEEVKELGEINASQDRFRYRFHEEDYRNDVDRIAADNMRWLD